MTLQVAISEDFFTRGVSVTLGILAYRVATPDKAEIDRVFEETVSATEENLKGRKPAELPEIAAARQAFKKSGKDPSRYRPSSEALMRRIASGKGLYRVSPVVDVNNIISIRTGWPIGTYDITAINGDATFRIARSGEPYQGIGRGELNIEGLPCFADAKGPFGTPMSDSERTKVTEETKDVMSVLIGFDKVNDMTRLVGEAADLLKDLLYAEITRTSVSQNW